MSFLKDWSFSGKTTGWASLQTKKKKFFSKEYGNHTGLGLFLAREICSVTGITLKESGEPGKRARFELLVPAGSYRSAKAGKNQLHESGRKPIKFVTRQV